MILTKPKMSQLLVSLTDFLEMFVFCMNENVAEVCMNEEVTYVCMNEEVTDVSETYVPPDFLR